MVKIFLSHQKGLYQQTLPSLDGELVNNTSIMDEEQKVTLEPTEAAPEATPSPDETPSSEPEKVYAGKYKSAEELEKAYKEAQAKISQKGFSEKLGEEVVKATGYSVDELTQAGYSETQIVEAMLNKTAPVAPPVNDPVKPIKEAVESSQISSVKFELELERLYRKNADAEQLDDWIRKFKQLPDNKSRSAAEIYEELKPLMKKGQEEAYAKQSEKERATVKVSHNVAPESKEYDISREAYKKSGHLDDAVGMIKSKLFGNK